MRKERGENRALPFKAEAAARFELTLQIE